MESPARNWIDGKFTGAVSLRESINPATGKVIGSYVDSGLEAAKLGVEAALRGFRESPWRHDIELRARVLTQIAEAFERNEGELVELLATENGKVMPEAAFELSLVAPKLRYYAAKAR